MITVTLTKHHAKLLSPHPLSPLYPGALSFCPHQNTLSNGSSADLLAAAGVPGVKPVIIELTDVKTKEKVESLEVDACLVATGRAPYTHVRTRSPTLI